MGYEQRRTTFKLRFSHSLDLCNPIKGLNALQYVLKEPLCCDKMVYYIHRALKGHTTGIS